MEKELMIDVTTFMNMFVSISYLQEQRIFSYNRICKYFKNVHWSDDTAPFCFGDLIDELNMVIDSMRKEGILSSIDGNLYQVTDKINYKDIILNNHDALADMIEVFFNICGGKDKTIYLVPSKNYQKK